jgi:4-methyl-5(b-hydroxyethyl)-thiazole monophosphate biosynthesis
MNKIYILLAEGFEEVEALTPADVLNRAGFEVVLVSTNNDLLVTGAHHIPVKCGCFIEHANSKDATMLILPGGMPGTLNLMACERVKSLVLEFHDAGKWIGAICAAPMIIGEMGLLKGKQATCYPGYEKHLIGADIVKVPAITHGKIVTGRGVGTAMNFSLEIVRNLLGKAASEELAKNMVV